MENKNYKIAIIGRRSMVLGFSAVGVDAFPISEKQEVLESFEKIKKIGNYAIVLIDENWAQQCPEIMSSTEALPAIIPVPNEKGASDYSLNNLKKIVEQAVGSDILFKE